MTAHALKELLVEMVEKSQRGQPLIVVHNPAFGLYPDHRAKIEIWPQDIQDFLQEYCHESQTSA